MQLNYSILGILAVGTVSIANLPNHHAQSDVGLDYKPLNQLLSQQKWEAAAAETQRLVFAATRRNHQQPIGQELLTQEAVETFPCRDLRTLDRLWVEHSQGRFGFSPQTQIWRQVDGPSDFQHLKQNESAWNHFTTQTGWHTRPWPTKPQTALADGQPPRDLPIGLLPDAVRSTGDFGDRAIGIDYPEFFGFSFLQRAQQCGLG